MKKCLFLFFLPILLSCSSFKYNNFDNENDFNFKGRIKSLNEINIVYPVFGGDTIISESEKYFNTDNTLDKVYSGLEKCRYEISYYYNSKKLLDSTISLFREKKTLRKFSYDNKGNLISTYSFEDGKLNYHKHTTYNNRNEPIEEKYINPSYRSNNGTEIFKYDYKNKVITSQSLDENGKKNNYHLNLYYDKKGNKFKSEFIYDNHEHNNYSKADFDKLNNVIKRTNYNSKGEIKDYTTYKYTYDKKGNIVDCEEFYKEQLLSKTTNKIVYR